MISPEKLDTLRDMLEEKLFIQALNETYDKYFKHGARSSKKANHFQTCVKNMLSLYFRKEHGYEIKINYNVKLCNAAKRKECDIAILKDATPYIIVPVKIIMSNYKQNKNNSWENLTGELSHIKWKNHKIAIVPINIFMNRTPYLKANKLIKKFENITTNDIKNYEELIKHRICYDVINYIVEVEHTKKVNEYFDEILPIKKFQTKYRTFRSIFGKLI